MSFSEVVRAVSTPYATFYSGGQKLARNWRGSIVGIAVSQNSDYTSQTIQVWFLPADGSPAVLAYNLVGASVHAPVVEAAESGEFYAFYVNWQTQTHNVLFWSDITASVSPVKTTETRSDTSSKSCAVWDETRRSLWTINNGNGRLMRWNETGQYVNEKTLLASTATGRLEYPVLVITPHGWLAIAVSSHEVASPTPSYKALLAGWSPDGRYWTHLRVPMDDWGAGFPFVYDTASQAAPADSGGLQLLREEESNWTCLISAFLVDAGATHLVYSVVPKRGAKFVGDDGKSTLMIHQKFDMRTGKRTIYTSPLRVGGLKPWFPGSFMTRRGGKLYYVVVGGHDLVVGRSEDEGKTWTEHDRMNVTNTGMLHYLSCWRGFETDDFISGVVTNVDCTLQQWADGTGYPQPGRVIRFEFSL